MTSSPQEIFERQGKALSDANPDGIAQDFAADAILLTPAGIVTGRPAIRDWYADLLTKLPEAKWDVYTVVFSDDALMIEWRAESATNRADHGVDTFVFAEGAIRLQTATYTLTPGS